MDQLIDVMRALRNPDGGCPWDLEQDFKSIAPYTIEEAYEVADAIEQGDMDHLCEELGDLLLQSVYHAQMAREEGHFDIYDVIRGITGKMISRHPHVFGDHNAQSASDVNTLWEERKAAEKRQKGQTENSALEGVPQALPALLRTYKLQKKAAKTGFEWPEFSQILNKLEEELEELREAQETQNQAHIEEEFGDLLFVLVNYGRKLGINPENALRSANNKFEKRFKDLEKYFQKKNEDIKDASLDQMIQGWKIIKS